MWPLVPIGDVCIIERGASPRPIHDFLTDAPDGVNWIKIGDAEVGAKYITTTKECVTPEGAAKSRRVKPGDFILSNSMSFGRPYVMATDGCIHDGWLLLRDQSPLLDQDFLYSVLGSDRVFAQFKQAATGGVVNNLNSEIVRRVQIPLPPLEVQKEIVAEIEGYQKVINGARAVLDHYRPHIPIHPDWPMVELGEACDVRDGTHDSPKYVLEGYPLITSKNLKNGFIDFTEVNLITREDLDAINKRSKVDAGDILMPMIGTIGNPVVADDSREYAVKNVALIKFPKGCQMDNRFLKDVLDSAAMQDRFNRQASGSTQKFIPLGFIRKLEIPLPPLATQQAIVAEIEAEQALVAANRELIARFEQKIQATLARVWGEAADS